MQNANLQTSESKQVKFFTWQVTNTIEQNNKDINKLSTDEWPVAICKVLKNNINLSINTGRQILIMW